MAKIKALTNELLEKSDNLLKKIRFSKLSIKLKGIAALRNNSITKVAEVLSISRNTLKNWVKSFDAYGIEGLMLKPKSPKKTKLNNEQRDELASWIKNNPNMTLKEIRIKIIKEFNIFMSQSGLWYLLKKMNLSYITPRPRHYKQNKDQFDEFKKNSYQS